MPPRKLSLTATLTLAFSVLTIPVLAGLLTLSLVRNTQTIELLLQQQVERSQATIERATMALIRPIVQTVEFLAEFVAREPRLFRSRESLDLLYGRLAAAPRIDSVSVVFEDGFGQGVTRIDPARRRHDPHTPAAAQWHVSIISGPNHPGEREQIYFSDWGTQVGEHTAPAPFDPRTLGSYVGARSAGHAVVAPPTISAAAGELIISIAAPVMSGGKFMGAVSAAITSRELSEFMSDLRPSPGTVAFILDGEGQIVAHSVPELAAAERAMSPQSDEIRRKLEHEIAPLLQEFRARDDIFSLRQVVRGVESSIALFELKNPFGLPLDALVITPVEDFMGPLEATHTLILGCLIILIPLELLLIGRLSRGLSRGITDVAAQLESIRSMELAGDGEVRPGGSRVREVAALQSGFSLLRRALQSFACYVPVDLVRTLTESGEPVKLGVEPRELTILFCDLENFSTAAQAITPAELLDQITSYFSLATGAIAATGGTVDKFIGDAVMAFWNAPAPCPDHPLAACSAAIRIAEGLRKLNEEWRQSGRRTFHVRIGLHTGSALVGNIGTRERLSYTALGDTVNVASRLEGINKEFGTTICISAETYRRVEGRVTVRPLQPVEVKGRRGELMVYELTGLAASGPVVTPVQVAEPVPA